MWLIAWLRCRVIPGLASPSEAFGRSWDPESRNKNRKPTIKFANFYTQTLPKETTHVFAFLVPSTMPRLKKYLATQTLPNGKYLLVNAFPFKDGTEPTKIIRTEKNLPIYIYNLTKLTAKPSL